MSVSVLNAALDENGRLFARAVTAKKGASMYYSGPNFIVSSTQNPIWNFCDPVTLQKTPRNWATLKLYKPDGTETTNEPEAAYTVLDIIIEKDVEIIGGALACPPVFPTGNNDRDWRVWAYAAPMIPAAFGGQIPFVEDLKINDYYEGEDIIIDGRTPKYLKHLDVSNLPVTQHYAGMATDSSPAPDLESYLVSINYDGTQFSQGDLIVLNIADDNTENWKSYIHNGGTAGDASDFSDGILDLGWYENHIRFIFEHPTGLNPSVNSSDEVNFQLVFDMFIKWT